MKFQQHFIKPLLITSVVLGLLTLAGVYPQQYQQKQQVVLKMALLRDSVKTASIHALEAKNAAAALTVSNQLMNAHLLSNAGLLYADGQLLAGTVPLSHLANIPFDQIKLHIDQQAILSVQPLKNAQGQIKGWLYLQQKAHDYQRAFWRSVWVAVLLLVASWAIIAAVLWFWTKQLFLPLSHFLTTLPQWLADKNYTARLPNAVSQPQEWLMLSQAINPLLATIEQQHDALQRAEQATATHDAAKSQFLAIMSHEIRTPMNGVMGMTELLLDTQLNERQQQIVETIHISSLSLSSIINDILDFVHIESGSVTLHEETFDVYKLLEEVVALFAGAAQRKNLELITYIPDRFPLELRGAEGRLRQVLSCLLANAIKFTDNGEIMLRVLCVGENEQFIQLGIEIEDTGIGIAPQMLQNLFKPFNQVDSTYNRRYGGTGLGLAIAKHLVVRMGGDIGARSDYGHGSTFWFTVKLAKPAYSVTLGLKKQEKQYFKSKKRVLVVEDNHSNQINLKRYIESWGLACDVASTSAEAMQLIQQAQPPYAIALINYAFNADTTGAAEHMPMTGIELIETLKQNPAIAPMAFVLMITINQTLSLKAHDLLEATLIKPIRRDRLYSVLQQLLDEPQALHQKQKAKELVKINAKILLVEDNIVNQQVSKLMLAQWHCQMDFAGDGLNAVKKLVNERYDLVFMDCQMPEIDGYAATRIIRQQEQSQRNQRNIIIALTAHALKGDKALCLAAGMDDYLSKPFNKAQMLAILQKWLPISAFIYKTEDVPHVQHIIDDKWLSRLGDLPLITQALLQQYQQHSDQLLDLLRKAVIQMDFKAIQNLSHRLKSSSANIGAERLSQELAILEQQAQQHHTALISGQMSRIETQYTLLFSALERKWN